MADETAVLESSPVEMDVSRGPLVDITPEQRAEFRKTGNLPKPEEAASSSEPTPVKVEAEPAGDSEPPEPKQELPKAKPKQTAEERIAQLEATIEKIKKGKGIETPKAESSPAKPEPKPVPQQASRPKPTVEDKTEDGKPKYETYEDYIEDLADWKTEQKWSAKEQQERTNAAATALNAKIEEGRTRYENLDDVIVPAANEIYNDAAISPVIKQMIADSDLIVDLVYTIANDPAEYAKFVKMAKETPGKAIRYIALTESLISQELDGKTAAKIEVEPPAKPKTQAPKPPSEAGGRAAAPPDALESAAKANDFRSFKAEATRRQLAKLKG